MMTYVAPRKKKIATLLTGTSHDLWLPVPDQLAAIHQSSLRVAKTIVAGQDAPKEAAGLRWTRTQPNPPIKNLMGTYMLSMPGSEVCAICAGDIVLGADHTLLLDMVFKQRFDLSWAAYSMSDKLEPGERGYYKLFVMSAAIIPHIMNDMESGITFGMEWGDWLHKWMVRYMSPQRYLNATGMGLVEDVKRPEVMSAYQPEPQPAPKHKKAKA